jgi:hypothetical protein
MACNPLISDPFTFPTPPANRAGLPRIAYRIGRYGDFVEAMIRRIDAAPELAAWTHRNPDDPGIALIEGAAILGDILTFYQEHYANEAFLNTAAWRESVAELVRLTGYRLAPGLGGHATFAFEVRGKNPVTIPAAFAVKVDLAEITAPADFATAAELIAWPHLGRFNLYRERHYGSTVAAGAHAFELATVGGSSDPDAVATLQLKKGDQLMLVPPEPSWTQSGSSLGTQQAAQVVKVSKVTTALGRTLVEIDGALADGWAAPVRAYRVGRTFRHFGHNAPPKTIDNDTDSSGTITGAIQSDTGFDRHVYVGHNCTLSSATAPLAARLLPLDREVNDLSLHAPMIVTTRIGVTGGSDRVALTVVKTITALRSGTLGFGNINGPTTFVTLSTPLIRHLGLADPLSDVRDYLAYETTSLALTLRPVATFTGGTFAGGTNALQLFGTAEQAQAIAGRHLYLLHADGRSIDLVCTNQASDFPGTAAAPRMWPLSFDRAPAPFRRSDFDEISPNVTVFGNLADATQGKLEHEAVLGNGDARQSFQTFPLPKAPLTYFLSADGIPPQTPELQIWVAGRPWSRVDSFFGRGPKETIYIVREDADGKSFVQFGDGDTGARLPSGVKNVSAIYRTGVRARGPIKPGATPSASARPEGFDKVTLAGIVAGGADPEDLDKARESAPGKVQSLGRLVSIRDYETETVSIPGVVTATAAWGLHDGVPAVILGVLLEAGRKAEFADVRATIAHAQRCHGPDRFPVVVEEALLRYVFLDLSYARDATYRQDDVQAAIRAELGLAGDAAHERGGVFGLRARRIGEREYASRIEGRVQNVPGVLWCRVTALGRFTGGIVDPATLVLPAAPRPHVAVLSCSAHELLQLSERHFTLTEAAEPAAGECA